MTTHNVLKGPRYDYTPDGKLARRTWARGVVTDYTYDNAEVREGLTPVNMSQCHLC